MIDEIEATVTGILAAATGRPGAEIAAGQALDDLGLDSIGMVEALFAIEEALGIALPISAGDGAPQTVGDLVALARRLVAARAA
jgi:acyl carrier protein